MLSLARASAAGGETRGAPASSADGPEGDRHRKSEQGIVGRSESAVHDECSIRDRVIIHRCRRLGKSYVLCASPSQASPRRGIPPAPPAQGSKLLGASTLLQSDDRIIIMAPATERQRSRRNMTGWARTRTAIRKWRHDESASTQRASKDSIRVSQQYGGGEHQPATAMEEKERKDASTWPRRHPSHDRVPPNCKSQDEQRYEEKPRGDRRDG